MKSILISVKPKWAELIMNGKKTIEVRKSCPKPPFKVYGYVTQSGNELQYFYNYGNYRIITKDSHWGQGQTINFGAVCNGKVAFEYVVRDVSTLNIAGVEFFGVKDTLLKKACFTHSSLAQYVGTDSKNFYAWHISELKIYDKPKELNEFGVFCKDFINCKNISCRKDTCRCGFIPIGKAPRNYIYVSDLSEVEK